MGSSDAYQRVFEQNHQRIPHSWDKIEPCDILLTHGPAAGILDWMEGTGRPWGSSKLLKERILEIKPRAHLFGHLHEQRGYWLRRKDAPSYNGGVQYQRVPNVRWEENESPPPPDNYPVDLCSCNAMKNHNKLDGAPSRLLGLPRVIICTKEEERGWVFKVGEH